MSDPTFCNTCKVNCRTAEKYESHLKSELHLKIFSGSGGSLFNNTSSPRPTSSDPSFDSGSQGGGSGMNRGRGSYSGTRGRGRGGRGTLYSSFVSGKEQSLGAQDDPASKIHGSKPASNPTEKPMPNTKNTSTKGGTFCEVCQISTSGPESYEQHIKGTKHRKMMVKAGISVPEKRVRPVKYQEGNVHLQSSIDGYPDPLVGLQYLVEFQNPVNHQPTSYECFLCDAQMDVRNAMAHIMGFKHKHTYLKIHYADRKMEGQGYGSSMMPNGPAWKQFVAEQTIIVAAAEGRHPISVYEWDGITASNKPDVHTGAHPFKRARIIATSQAPPVGFAAKKQAVTGSSGHPEPSSSQVQMTGGGGEASLLKLLGALENYIIRSEMEAGLVIKIQNSLANSLEEYNSKKSSSPGGQPATFDTATSSTTTFSRAAGSPHVSSNPYSDYSHNYSRNSPMSNWSPNGNKRMLDGYGYGYGYGQRHDLFNQNAWY